MDHTSQKRTADFSLTDRALVSRMIRELGQQGLIGRPGDSPLMFLREADRFERCGRYHRVYTCESCQHNFRLPCSCNSRICPSCGRRFYARMKGRILEAIRPYWSKRQKTYGPKFLTLTFARERFAVGLPTYTDLDRAAREVRTFIRRFYSKHEARLSRNGHWYLTKKWRGCGALVVPELGNNDNLHFHLLVYGPYIRQKTLAQAWLEITGDSFVVDVQEVKKPEAAAGYILKYITKPPAVDSFAVLAAWSVALKGKRRVATYGVFFGVVLTKPAKRAGGLVCIFDGAGLHYRGDFLDPQQVLIDWLQFQKYVDPEAGIYARTYLDGLGMPPTSDKNFFREVDYAAYQK